MILRAYQQRAVESVLAELKTNRSTVVVMPTGSGKTQVFSELINRTPGRALVIAHRDELIGQAQGRIEEVTGRPVELEQAEYRASTLYAHTVVASVQTISQPARLERWSPKAFDLIVVDEAHHAPAPTYRRVLDHFAGAKVLGVTATPDRADRLALGQVFDSVAFCYEIEDAIRDGWLCPIRVTSVRANSIDLERVRTTAGDLNGADLDAIMRTEENLHAVARPALELAGDRRTLVFTTSVENAHRLAEVFNRYRAGCAGAVDGGTEKQERREILGNHRASKFQFLCNVGVLTEGYDDPEIACIAMGRPTKSRALYCQMAGRGTRIAPGKTDLLVLDFTGNAGRHRLVTAHDILAGKYSDEVVARAREITEKEAGADVGEALAAAERQLREEQEAARRAAVKARVRYTAVPLDAFGVLGVKDPAHAFGGQFGGVPATEPQLAALRNMKVTIPANCTKQQATKLIGTIIKRRKIGLCTYAQAEILRKRGYDTSRLSFARAHALIDALAANRWRDLTANDNARILGGSSGMADVSG